MFDAIDTRNGPARGVLGLKQFVRWARDNIFGKVVTVDMKTRSSTAWMITLHLAMKSVEKQSAINGCTSIS